MISTIFKSPLPLSSKVVGVTAQFFPQAWREDSECYYGVWVPERYSRAVSKRKAEFVAARVCARHAIRELTGTDTSALIGVNDDRSPQWPKGIVGSLSHTDGLVFAAVALSKDVLSIGVDVETKVEPCHTELIVESVADEQELLLLAKAGLGSETACTLIFSGKESVFKCLYPLTKTYFGFRNLKVVAVDQANQVIKVALDQSVGDLFSKGFCLNVQYAFQGGYVYTSCALMQSDNPTFDTSISRGGEGIP